MPEINFQIEATVGENKLKVVAINRRDAEDLFNKYKKEILLI